MRSNYSIVAAIAGLSLLASAVTVPVRAEELTQASQEAVSCDDLRDAMIAMFKSRKELGEAVAGSAGDPNQAAIQEVRNTTVASIKRTDAVMSKLHCVKPQLDMQKLN